MSYHSHKLLAILKIWKLHVTLLNIKDGDVPITRNTIVNYNHLPSTHIVVQVLYTIIQSKLIPYKHHYLIYYLQTFLLILKFRYPALNIVINSSPSSRVSILCVTPFSSQSLTIYGLRIKISESSVVTMNNTVNGYIYAFFLSALSHVYATSFTWTHQHASPS